MSMTVITDALYQFWQSLMAQFYSLGSVGMTVVVMAFGAVVFIIISKMRS